MGDLQLYQLTIWMMGCLKGFGEWVVMVVVMVVVVVVSMMVGMVVVIVFIMVGIG